MMEAFEEDVWHQPLTYSHMSIYIACIKMQAYIKISEKIIKRQYMIYTFKVLLLRFGILISWYRASVAHMEPWVQALALHKPL